MTMVLRWAARVAFAALLVCVPAAAQEFGNPFLTAAEMRIARGAAPDAAMRYVYEEIGGPTPGRVTIDVAADWSLTTRPDRVILRDFRLSRLIFIDPASGAFVSYNLAADVTFRVFQIYMRAGGGAGPAGNVCDAETELAVIVSEMEVQGETRVRGREVSCGGAEVGDYERGDGDAAPAAFWPTLAHEFNVHPRLRQLVREDGRAPRELSTRFRDAANAEQTVSWRLISAEAVATPYPLREGAQNQTAALLEQVSAGLGALAVEAVAGRAAGGPPTIASFDALMRERAAVNRGAAAMMLNVFGNLFPGAMETCTPEAPLYICGALATLAADAQADPALLALFLVAQAEQSNQLSSVIDVMRSAQGSPNANDPVLGASYALALVRGGAALQQQAQAAGLPHDPIVLQAAAIAAYPYLGAYWTDLGDTFVHRGDFARALLFYDVATSLPGPPEQQRGGPIMAKRTFVGALVTGQPDFFMQ